MEGTILNSLGRIYMRLSQYERAISSYEQAMAIQREVKDWAGEGITLNNLGRGLQGPVPVRTGDWLL